MLADYHIHSEFSDDSTEPMEQVIHNAITKSFNEICFTDHVDYGVKDDHDPSVWQDPKLLNVDYPRYFKKIETLREEYREQITIRAGLEFGIQTHTIKEYRHLMDTYPLDFVLLSCHQVDNKEFWTQDFQRGSTIDEYNQRYYEEIYDCMKLYKDYSVLAHLDMIQRYNETVYPLENSIDIITKILKLAIEDNKGIEINTSSFRYGLADLMPARGILKLYHELGGTILTIGSDCHRAEDLGDHFIYVKEELKKIGFQNFCTFERMKPIFHEL